jgi:bacterioferritin
VRAGSTGPLDADGETTVAEPTAHLSHAAGAPGDPAPVGTSDDDDGAAVQRPDPRPDATPTFDPTTRSTPEERDTVTTEKLITAMNEDLELEYRSIVQYIQHLAVVKGARFQGIRDEISAHIGQEVQHALTLATQIDFLGGTPTVDVAPVHADTTTPEALASDLALEERQLDRYRERIEQANELGLPDVADILSPLLTETQEHIRDLRAALG